MAFAHRRLSVIDVSPAGHQPMASPGGRFWIVFNGEIYNHRELRRELEREGARFRGHSDTEVILAAAERWGLERAVRRSVGMFALALWDRATRTLCLVRDRLGEKPLYYGLLDGVFLFGSELKALRVHPAWRGEIDRCALTAYMRFNYVPAPYSIYRGVFKLLPGCILEIAFDRLARCRAVGPAPDGGAAIRPRRYWSARSIAARADGATPLSETEAVERLEARLRDTIAHQMIADVPLGALLSGGVDSSTVTALMQAQSPRPIRTFTIGFLEDEYNEARHAAAVAKHLGTEHTELYVTAADALEVIPALPEIYDEPFSDASQIPTVLLSRLARQAVTVGLSGDGGDELFGGYNRYFWGRNIWRAIGWMPWWLRAATAAGVRTVPPAVWDALLRVPAGLLPRRLRERNLGDELHKAAEILSVDRPEAMYMKLVSHWKAPWTIVIGGDEPQTVLSDGSQRVPSLDFLQQMMYLDTVSYLPDDILTKVDRASMSTSLEVRAPMLDHRLVEFAWELPLSMKVRNGEGKWLLRQVLYKYVPRELVERPKKGFGAPIGRWLRGPLRDWAEELLQEHRLRSEGFFDPAPIRHKWQEHLSGRRNWEYHLWDVLMFQAWARAGGV